MPVEAQESEVESLRSASLHLHNEHALAISVLLPDALAEVVFPVLWKVHFNSVQSGSVRFNFSSILIFIVLRDGFEQITIQKKQKVTKECPLIRPVGESIGHQKRISAKYKALYKLGT